MVRQEQILFRAAQAVNWVAAGAVTSMMLLVSADVVLRFFRSPIPGAYDLVGFLATLAVSLSLSYTTVTKSHIAVEFLVEKLPRKIRHAIDALNSLVAFILFLIITWQTALYSLYMRSTGEVSMTLKIPVYPFVLGLTVGCGFLCVILAFQFYTSVRRVAKL
ncbi:MAG: TRAP transporter small permease [Syntrophales bacterium]|nr:TRAP transporter small permease [Syntrophales bacterium]